MSEVRLSDGHQAEVRLEQVRGAAKRAALSLLLTGAGRSNDPAIDTFLAFTQDQRLSTEQTWAALVNGMPVASVLMTPSSGRTAMLFMSSARLAERAPVMADLLIRAARAQYPDVVRLVQALIEPDEVGEASALELAGFRRLATLAYLQREGFGPTSPLTLPDGIVARTWNEGRHDLFGRCILASYEQTLDCPGLVGMREIDDVLEGHKASGVFTPSLWYALTTADDEPVGVMLLNKSAQRPALEVVYLGLAPAWRGRGLGRLLMHHALGQIRPQRMRSMVLAVDEQNVPAARLYASMGFVKTVSKIAYVLSLKDLEAF